MRRFYDENGRKYDCNYRNVHWYVNHNMHLLLFVERDQVCVFLVVGAPWDPPPIKLNDKIRFYNIEKTNGHVVISTA